MSANKMVYFFGDGTAEGDLSMRNSIGGKGANLANMTNLGVPVPAGFTITTDVCVDFYNNGRRWPEGLEEQVRANITKVEKAMDGEFGSDENPLLLSVRSGARVSMPGMMDTVLNLGLNDKSIQGLIQKSNDPRFAYDSYRRFVQMYGEVVMGVDAAKFETLITELKESRGVELDTELAAEDWKGLVARFKQLVKEESGQDFPDDPWEQLVGSINAVFDSWFNPRADRYRRINNIPGGWGTAANVQSMVYGNLGETSGTGVAFTRDPSTGEKVYYGEYLINAQGEDVVAGVRTPDPISTLEELKPEIYKELTDIFDSLEKHYREMQDLEFTIQEGKLYILQTRSGKRTAQAAVRIAVEMVREQLIDEKTAVTRVEPEQLDQLLHPGISDAARADAELVTTGIAASPGAAVGKAVFTAADAEEWAARGESVILIRLETSPDDIGGMDAARGILTSRGGKTSHAAVVARGMGKSCVVGAGGLQIQEAAKRAVAGSMVIEEGDEITIDGATGEVFKGALALEEPELSGDFAELMTWADKYRRLKVRTNADTPHDAQVAKEFGAEGIGLCRTEHMFFGEGRITAVREMILAQSEDDRRQALAKLLPIQREDFYGIFKAMDGLPVTIRLLDPPLHEFLPSDEQAIVQVAKDLGIEAEELRQRIQALHEFNPMLGHRGCRLGITYPEIYEMQVQAILEAAVQLAKEGGSVIPEIMIPLIGTVREFNDLKEVSDKVAQEVFAEAGVEVEYQVGTMIEIPRAVLIADEIAKEAEFYSFGTNDLTQLAYGYSRDDAGLFLSEYLEKGILERDPFQTIDQDGVGTLIRMGVEKGRSTNPDLPIGICGEHGGDPDSVKFCHETGFDYVSCSPFRVPIARLAAAQANIESSS